MDSYRNKQIFMAILTFVVYTALMNWKVALLLMVGVGFHEYCHLWAAKRMGLQTKGFFLVPFMGGVALVGERYRSYAQQAFVVLAGPAGGGLLAFVTAGAYYLTGLPFLAAAAYWMGFLNLFNLYPLSFLDGGQLLDTVSYSINRTLGVILHTLSFFLAVVLLIKANFVIAILVIFFGGSSVLSEWRNWKALKEGKEWLLSDSWLNPPRKMRTSKIVLTVAGWVTTVILLVILMAVLKEHPESDLSTILPVKK
jgi:putative peptide zinc metalloprotease protein